LGAQYILVLIEESCNRPSNYRICLYILRNFVWLWKYWIVGCEATYLCLCLASHSNWNHSSSPFHVQVWECRGLCTHLQHRCSTLLQILEKDLFHIVKQQLLYKHYVNFTLLIAATCYSFIPISLFTYLSTGFLYLKTFSVIWISCILFDEVLLMYSELETMWKSEARTYIRVIRTDVLQGLMWTMEACCVKDLRTDRQHCELFSTIIC
jgi:hypothetical protein